MKFLRRIGFAFFTLLMAAGAQAQTYPSRSVRIVVPFGAGSITDSLARILAERLTGMWAQSVVVENRPGPPGANSVANSTPDGYTLMLTSTGHVIAKAISKTISFDPVTDFTGVIQVANVPQVLAVAQDLPVKSLKEFIDAARAKPGAFNYSSAGVASSSFLLGEVLRQAADIKMVHVPFKSASEAVTALLRGDVQMYFMPILDAVELGAANKVRVIAIGSGKRVSQLPDVPTIAEAGLPSFQYEGWFGVLAPAQTPRPIIDRVNTDIATLLRSDDVSGRLLRQGAIPAPNSPAEFDAIIKADAERYTRIIAAAGITAN